MNPLLVSVISVMICRTVLASPPDDFSTDTGLWTYSGSARRDAAGQYVVLTENSDWTWGQIWLKEPRYTPFVVRFRYRAGGGTGGDGLVFLFHKSMDYSPTYPDYGGFLGFSRAPFGSLEPVPGYGVELDSVPNWWDPSANHVALIQDQPANHLTSVDDVRTSDNLWHSVEVQVGSASVDVSIDGQRVLSWQGSIDRTYGGIGFSAATGAYNSWHLIDDFSLIDVGSTQVLDNGDAGTSSTGYWQVSGAPGPYGRDSVFARNGASYTYQKPLPAPGRYDLAVWWTAFPSRSTAVPIVVEHAEGNTTLFVDQTGGGGMWNALGTFTFGGVATVRILALGTATTCADAVGLIPRDAPPPPPEAPEIIIDDGGPGASSTGTWAVSGAPNPFGGRSLYSKQAGATYTYSTTIDQSGVYDVYTWWTEWPSRSSAVPLEIRHADGTSTVKVNQLSGGGRWNLLGRFNFSTFAVVRIQSAGVSTTCADAVRLLGVGVAPPPPPTGFTVLDNDAPGTSSTGTWLLSGGSNSYGTDSLYSRLAGTYSFSARTVGAFNVYAWWTAWPSRSGSVPITIRHAGGTSTVRVDQTLNGGQWNLLGKFTFDGEAVVTVISEGGGSSTCADAIRLQP